MTTALITHESYLSHDTGPGHPERPARLTAVLKALEAPEFGDLARYEAPKVEAADLLRVHPEAHLRALEAAMPASGLRRLDPDTVVSPGSYDACLRAAGAVTTAVDMVVDGRVNNAFCAVRPPGHHAEPDRAMGFCIFNNIAVGALRAQQLHGLKTVAVIDFDVHHGNGTEAMFQGRAGLVYASSHQYPFYPGTGAATSGEGGNIINVPLAAGSGSAAFRAAYTKTILPALYAAKPDLVMISAGFDAHAADPLASLQLTTEDFRWITEALMALARETADNRIVSVLEGGYDLDALAASAAAHVLALMAVDS